MNHAIRAAVFGPRAASPSTISVSFFHSTPVLERKRRTNWHSSWRDEDERNARNDGAPWFRRHYWARGTKKSGFCVHEPQSEDYRNKRRGAFVFCSTDDDDDDVETIFRSAFGRARYSYWSFSGSENFQRRNSSSHAYSKSSWNWSYESDDETDTSQESELASERLALGLSASGPLKLEEVKIAYRACAFRWHPDRHQGASKIAAEEKFKHCSAAYKTLCDRLTVS
ncbi:uncharacterized protein LOC103710537 isoform X2 [Phoenix dactylifera]|uniref:Uncharacterized protein LOC103710537 isoform X2 n=1 Tax=Phoenix dactylifera TaxID=42345 RepID=A0A8B7C9B7_PHODC|nr:uncharacterized protein LOC103710537 isoform X2 [Phoenix dactylifera]